MNPRAAAATLSVQMHRVYAASRGAYQADNASERFAMIADTLELMAEQARDLSRIMAFVPDLEGELPGFDNPPPPEANQTSSSRAAADALPRKLFGTR